MSRPPPLNRVTAPVDWDTTTARLAVNPVRRRGCRVPGPQAGGQVDGGLLGAQEGARRHDHPVAAQDEGAVDCRELLHRLPEAGVEDVLLLVPVAAEGVDHHLPAVGQHPVIVPDRRRSCPTGRPSRPSRAMSVAHLQDLLQHLRLHVAQRGGRGIGEDRGKLPADVDDQERVQGARVGHAREAHDRVSAGQKAARDGEQQRELDLVGPVQGGEGHPQHQGDGSPCLAAAAPSRR